MCIGTPLKVLTIDEAGWAQCAEACGQTYFQPVQTVLLDTTPKSGDWVLTHIDTAIRALSENEALQIVAALAAVKAASRGDPFEHLLADLIDREPELPVHLRAVKADTHHGVAGEE